MKNYIKLGKKILKKGYIELTRTGETLALHNEKLSFNLKKSFPLMTTKHIGYKSIIYETLWYLKGTTNIKYLKNNNVNIWNKFGDENDDIGKTYSYQFRNFNGIDQIKEVIKQLKDKNNITNRRAIINLYNVSDLKEMSIPPCIALIQFNIYYVNNEKRLDSSIYQRSADFCLGVPYDIAEMALLTHIIATYTDSNPYNMTIFYSNIHIYKEHIETFKEQANNKPDKLPILKLEKEKIVNLKFEDLTIDLFNFINIKKRKKYLYKLL